MTSLSPRQDIRQPKLPQLASANTSSSNHSFKSKVSAMDILDFPIELPKSHNYIFDSYKSLTSGFSGVIKFEAEFCLNITSEITGQNWFEELV
jgi:hypothetical protein